MLSARPLFVWDVVLTDEDAKIHEVEFASYWSPSRDYVTADSIAAACAAQATVAHRKGFLPVSASLREDLIAA